MRIAIMGAGGIGAYYGAALVRSGADVSFMARGAHLAAMRQRGLTIEEPDGTTFKVHPIMASDKAADLGPVDAVLLCVKMYDVLEAAEQCKPLMGPETFVVALQNGVEAVELVDRVLGQGRTLGGAAFVAGTLIEPGLVKRVNQMTRIEFGQADGSQSPRVRALCNILTQAGLDAAISPNVDTMLWSKFALMTSNAATTALGRVDTGVVRADPVMRGMYEAALRETVAVGRAKGVALADDIVERTLDWLDTAHPLKASLCVDLERGKRLELEWLSGAIHRMGQELGVPTPVHSTVYAALRPYRDGKPPG